MKARKNPPNAKLLSFSQTYPSFPDQKKDLPHTQPSHIPTYKILSTFLHHSHLFFSAHPHLTLLHLRVVVHALCEDMSRLCEELLQASLKGQFPVPLEHDNYHGGKHHD